MKREEREERGRGRREEEGGERKRKERGRRRKEEEGGEGKRERKKREERGCSCLDELLTALVSSCSTSSNAAVPLPMVLSSLVISLIFFRLSLEVVSLILTDSSILAKLL